MPALRDQLETRLHNLRSELVDGRRQLGELESQAQALRDTLLRISGAIQVLEEELADGNGDGSGE